MYLVIIVISQNKNSRFETSLKRLYIVYLITNYELRITIPRNS